MNARRPGTQPPCPCGTGKPYAQCCAPMLDQAQPAATAEQLMRSRYTAFTRQRGDYLLATWHPSTRPATMDAGSWPDQWLGLEVRRHRVSLDDPDQASVEFVARSRTAGRATRLHETSRFVREAGRWFYLDGVIR